MLPSSGYHLSRGYLRRGFYKLRRSEKGAQSSENPFLNHFKCLQGAPEQPETLKAPLPSPANVQSSQKLIFLKNLKKTEILKKIEEN